VSTTPFRLLSAINGKLATTVAASKAGGASQVSFRRYRSFPTGDLGHNKGRGSSSRTISTRSSRTMSTSSPKEHLNQVRKQVHCISGRCNPPQVGGVVGFYC
jgi:hypothetical protein